jgi:hypothetical protein
MLWSAPRSGFDPLGRSPGSSLSAGVVKISQKRSQSSHQSLCSRSFAVTAPMIRPWDSDVSVPSASHGEHSRELEAGEALTADPKRAG